uniref:Uncharacterized protein n=1 Tax=Lactuca sativa TaxID=4236 RepID=A0A9R1XSV2_LACSA|nr:hypothetical protein LSAT_V11C100043200 [Lactuca sativa]
MAFNNKVLTCYYPFLFNYCNYIIISLVFQDAMMVVLLLLLVLLPMAQSIGPILSQIESSPTIPCRAEMTLKNLENLNPRIMKQVIPLIEQLPPLYMESANGRDNFSPKPEETRRLLKHYDFVVHINSYYGISRNLLIKFKDGTIDETSTLAHVLSSESAFCSVLDMSICSLPGDHGLPLHQALPNVPPGMVDAINRGGELFANLTAGTPWEAVAKEVGNSLGVDSPTLRENNSKVLDLLADTIIAWMITNTGAKLLKP